MEITSKQESVISHYKDGQLVAITHSNGRSELMKVTEMLKKDMEDFFEVDQVKQSL